MATVVTDEVVRLQTALAEHYEVGRQVGHGGMARVYLARDLRHGRDVALKVLRPEIAASLGTERFLREIRIEAGLQHPNILPLHDSGAANGLLYYVMPFVQGETLRDRLAREKQLPLSDALQVAREVADALAYAHSHNVIHRDIKPANILLSAGHAVVSDFGIARAITAAAEEQLTESGLAVGTSAYMSPEQATGETDLDGRSDIYSLGCVLYEMLAGDPPFQGRTAQAILARHLHDPPPPLRVRRPSVPRAVEAALLTALAKVPADRFATASQFMDALAGEAKRGVPWSGRRWLARPAPKILVASGLVLLAGLGYWHFGRAHSRALDPNRVMVFPLEQASTAGTVEGSGDAVATYIGYALEGAAPLRWLEGRDFLTAGDLSRKGTLPTAEARRISTTQRAGYYIDGSIMVGPDSVTVVLRLHDVAGDSLLRRAGASSHAADASLPKLGLHAVGDLLPVLLEPGRKVDLTALSERRPTAIANFLQGEREYRRMRFTSALQHYRLALSEDSALAIAAVKGAQAANWANLAGEDAELVGLALEREAALPPRLAFFAHGLRDYLAGAADSALKGFRSALAIDSTWSEAWMAMGEVYYHLLPQATSLDSLARVAFERAHQADSSFTPPRFHLAEIALREGDLGRAKELLAGLEQADPDSTFSRPLALMYQCVRSGPASVDWRKAAAKDPKAVLDASQALAGRGAQPACARAGFETVLSASSVEHRWGALLGLQGLLAAMGQGRALDSVLAQGERSGLPGRALYLLDAAAGTGHEHQAATVSAEAGRQYDSVSTPKLWFLAEWEVRRGGLQNLQEIAAVVDRRAISSPNRTDSLFAKIMAAQLERVRGDTATAIAMLRALTPTAAYADLLWQPWEALAGERLALASLLLGTDRAAEADQVAAELDSHRAVVYLAYLPATLALRARAAEMLGRPERAASYRARLARLRQGTASPVGSQF